MSTGETPAVLDYPRVILYSKPDCHLCDEAEVLLRQLSLDLGLSYTKVDIFSSLELLSEYRVRIPVIEVVGRATFDWPTTADQVKEAVLAADPPS